MGGDWICGAGWIGKLVLAVFRGGVELSLSEAAFFEGRGYSIGGLAMCAAVGVDCFWGKVDFVAGGGGLLQGTSGGGLALSAAVGVGRF